MLDATDLQRIREIIREELAGIKSKEAGQSASPKEIKPQKTAVKKED